MLGVFRLRFGWSLGMVKDTVCLLGEVTRLLGEAVCSSLLSMLGQLPFSVERRALGKRSSTFGGVILPLLPLPVPALVSERGERIRLVAISHCSSCNLPVIMRTSSRASSRSAKALFKRRARNSVSDVHWFYKVANYVLIDGF